MILMIDNYDSFTYNLVAYFKELGQRVEVFRNDKISIDQIAALKPSYIVISPGPCTPDEAGISKEVVRNFYDKMPILGVCLGHQAIASAFGGNVVRAKTPVHGIKDEIFYVEDKIFSEVEHPFCAARYHSLVVAEDTLPNDLAVIAHNKKKIVMALKHKHYPCYGFQFHPESILTNAGKQLLNNFLKQGEKNV